jgi:hypothetical protein
MAWLALDVDDDQPLTMGELEILVDGLSDEVAFTYVMDHLELTGARDVPPGPERTAAVNLAIDALRKLVARGLVEVGHTETGPRGRYAFVADHPEIVWLRLQRDSLSAEPSDLWFSCWCVNTPHGDDVARGHLAQENAKQD